MQTQSRLFNYFAVLSISVKISSFSRQSSDSLVFKSLKKGILWFIQYTLIIKTNYIKCDFNLQYSFIKQSEYENCPMIATGAGRKLQLNHRPGVILVY